MNLLLLLSALLSALTGVGARVAAPQPVQAVAQERVMRLAPPVVAVPHAVRPVVALPALVSVAAGAAIAIALVLSIPAWADRRRE